MQPKCSFFIFATLLCASLPLATAAIPRALPAGALPNDVRLQPLKDLDGYFPFTPPKSKAEWDKRAEYVRRQILVSQGLWPMPTKTPLNAVIHGKIDRPDYTVEKVYFESAPGFFVTGQSVPAEERQGQSAGRAVRSRPLEGRAAVAKKTTTRCGVKSPLAQERFERGGRSRFQSMCVQLARMGCVVWQWDMLSDSDSIQFSRKRDPRLRQAAARNEHDRKLGTLQPAGGGASAKRDGPADLELDPLARLSAEPAGSRPRAHRDDRRQRRRHADDAARGDRSAREAVVSGRDGQHGDARRLHLRERVAACA